jgi:hypothetical protein
MIKPREFWFCGIKETPSLVFGFQPVKVAIHVKVQIYDFRRREARWLKNSRFKKPISFKTCQSGFQPRTGQHIFFRVLKLEFGILLDFARPGVANSSGFGGGTPSRRLADCYALVSAESTPLASDVMLLPNTRYVPYTTTAIAARISAYSVIVCPCTLRIAASRVRMNNLVTKSIFLASLD